jgi:hypothetical protein
LVNFCHGEVSEVKEFYEERIHGFPRLEAQWLKLEFEDRLKVARDVWAMENGGAKK